MLVSVVVLSRKRAGGRLSSLSLDQMPVNPNDHSNDDSKTPGLLSGQLPLEGGQELIGMMRDTFRFRRLSRRFK